MAKELSWNNSANQFQREIGKKHGQKSSTRFYLGSDEKKALANVQRLEALWQAVKDRWENNKEVTGSLEDLCWDSETYAMACAISKGSWSVLLVPPILDDPEEMSKWHTGLRKRFPMIQVEVEDNYKPRIEAGTKSLLEKLNGVKEREDLRHQTKINQIKRITNTFGGIIQTKETLFDAINAYFEGVKNKNKDKDGKPNESAYEQIKRGKRVICHTKDLPLSEFGCGEIYKIIEYWQNRPTSSLGKKFSPTTCNNTLSFFKKFLKWLNKSTDFPWKKPYDLEIENTSVKFEVNEIKKKEYYTVDELKILWDFATIFERKMLLLALNCGFGANDIGKLKWEDIIDNKIKGFRQKTGVYGEFLLWEITVKALGERKKDGLVFVTKNGECLVGTTECGNRKMNIPNAWNKLLNRVLKKYPDFKNLSFYNLRKSSANIIRKIADGETASVFLRHGEPVKKRKEVETYTTPAFEKVFEAQKNLWLMLKDIFTDLENVNSSRKLTLEQIEEIKKLKKEGIKSSFLAKKFNVTPNSIRRICRKPKNSTL